MESFYKIEQKSKREKKQKKYETQGLTQKAHHIANGSPIKKEF